MNNAVRTALVNFRKSYDASTSAKVRVIDGFLAFILATGIIQFVYCLLVGTFPFNSFLAGFISSVGTFVLTVSLRMQCNKENFAGRSLERAFGEYVFCMLILFLAVFNFIG